MERAVLKNVKDGDIVLLHDMTVSSVQAALDIVDVLKDQGYDDGQDLVDLFTK